MDKQTESIKQRLKNLLRWFLDLHQVYQILAPSSFLGSFAIVYWSHILFSPILKLPMANWSSRESFTFIAILLLCCSFFFQLGRVLILRKSKIPALPLSIVPDNEGHWEQNKGPIDGSFKFNMGFWITNTDDRPISIVKCEIAKYGLRGVLEVINKTNKGMVGQEFQFQKNEPVLLGVFFYPKKLELRPQASVVTNIIFTDNFNNRYLLKRCKFLNLVRQ